MNNSQASTPAPTPEALLSAARKVALNAYAPFSHFTVGAALLGEDGKVYAGCNAENASYGLTLCAERNALFHAVAEGCRAFRALAIVAPHAVPPCGACLQVLSTFCKPDLPIYLGDLTSQDFRTTSLSELFPSPFSL